MRGEWAGSEKREARGAESEAPSLLGVFCFLDRSPVVVVRELFFRHVGGDERQNNKKKVPGNNKLLSFSIAEIKVVLRLDLSSHSVDSIEDCPIAVQLQQLDRPVS